MWCSVARMKLLLLMITVVCVYGTQAKVTKKSGRDQVATLSIKDESAVTKPPSILPKKSRYPVTKIKTPNPQRAIIAIEIVDANDNSTKKRNGKRTIESSLGYGYQTSNYFDVSNKPPKYEVYKYSQRDIPPYHGPKNIFTESGSNFHIQKSIRYDLGSTKPELIHPKTIANYHQQGDRGSPQISQYYSPGTILYSSLDQQGNVGGLSSHAPVQQHTGGMVPVIILRVYTNQLGRPGALHPNLPQTHPYSGLNDIDLQSLLSGYAHDNTANYHQPLRYQPQQQQPLYYEPQVHQQQPQVHQQQPQVHQQQPQYQEEPHAPVYQHQVQQQSVQYYPQEEQGYTYERPTSYQPHPQLQTSENYPDDLHTKVIFHENQHQGGSRDQKKYKEIARTPGLAMYRTKPKEIRVTVPENAFSSIQVTEHDVPHVYKGNQQLTYQEEQGGGKVHEGAGQDVDYYPNQDAQQYYMQQQPQEHGHAQQQELEHAQQQQQQQQHYQQDAQQYQHQEAVQDQQQQYQQDDGQEQYQYVTQYDHQPVQYKNEHSVATREQPEKVYNYHAHGQLGTPKTEKREGKRKRKVSRIPLVLAPKVIDAMDSKLT